MRFFTDILTRRFLDLSSFSVTELPRRETHYVHVIHFTARSEIPHGFTAFHAKRRILILPPLRNEAY